MIISLSSRFIKSYQRLPDKIKKQAKEKEYIFRNDPFDSRIRLHKLVGKEKENWAFSVNHSYRIKFIFIEDDEVLFLDIGTHSIYT